MDLIAQIKRDETLSLSPYKDSVGKLTIGYGRNLTDEGISTDEAEFMLNNDIRAHAEALSKALPWTNKLDPIRQAALINMCFNMGIGGLMGFKRALTMLEAGNYAGAGAAFLESKWAKQVGDRANRLALQIVKGEWQ